MTLLIIGCFVVGALLLASAIMMFARSGAQQQEEVLLERLKQGEIGEQATRAVLQRDLRIPVLGPIIGLMRRGGIDASVATLTLALAVVLGIALVFAVASGIFAGAIVAALLLFVGYVVLWRRANRRRARIVEQLPGFLEDVVRVLSAGNSLEEAFALAAREAPEPLQQLCSSIARQVRLGGQLDLALAQAAEVNRLRDLAVMAMAVAVNRRYGGSIRNVLRGMIGAIRSRGTAAKELRALTAETRFSAFIVAGVSIGLLAYIYLRNPGYYTAMLQETGGRIAFYAALGLIAAGVAVLWRMVTSLDDPDA